MSAFIDGDTVLLKGENMGIKSNFLKMLPQYHFERIEFTTAFLNTFTAEQIEEIFSKCIDNEQTANFAFFRYDDEFYIMHKDSGTVINWYKHLGRTNTCNKDGFGLEDLKEFLHLIRVDLGWKNG